MDGNTAYTATSSMIVDLSGDNDNIGAIAAANSIPKTSDDSPFERSCDNPECSAPKLISLVPKRETAEFITEPTVMNQPTLVNGFTTVFQVDGLAAKMNDIMNGNYKGPTTSDGYGDQSNPKTVFRIVPNTHAHIVNYVVVDGAGETMRKIKSNDPDTMQKLLDSQKLSAEQMLRKLISKAFKTSCRKPEPLMPLPIPSKVPGYTHLGVPVQDTSTDSAAIPPVPAGITITPVVPDESSNSPLVININHKKVTPKINDKQTSKEKAPVKQSVGTSSKNAPNATGPNKNVSHKVAPKEASPKRTLPTVTVPNKTTPKGTSTTTTPASKLTSVTTTSASKSTPQITAATTLTSSKTSTPSSTTTSSIVTSTLTSPITTTAPTVTTPATGNILKRKQEPNNNPPDVIKRLRPRSPKQRAPLAVGLEPASTFTPPTRKLPMLPKLPTRPPPGTTDSPAQLNNPPKRATNTNVAAKSAVGTAPTATSKETPSSRSIEIAKAFASCLAEPEKPLSSEDLPAKVRPIIEPVSKVNPTKGLTTAQSIKTTLAAKVSAALASKTGITRIGETLITATSKSREDKSSASQTKTMSVPMHKAESSTLSTKINEFLQKEAALKATSSGSTSKPTATSHSTTVLTQTSELTSTGPKVIAQTKTNLAPIKLTQRASSPEKDPLAFDDLEKHSFITTRPAPSISKPETAPLTTRLDKTRSSPKEANVPSQKLQKQASNAKSGKVSTPSATPTRSLRVMLPVLKSGIMTIPVRSPHPNLKISSIMSGGSVVATASYKTSSKTNQSESEESGSEIDKLQQELADLRRTVQHLSKKKT